MSMVQLGMSVFLDCEDDNFLDGDQLKPDLVQLKSIHDKVVSPAHLRLHDDRSKHQQTICVEDFSHPEWRQCYDHLPGEKHTQVTLTYLFS